MSAAVIDRDREASLLHSDIESLASQARALEAAALRAVIAYTSAGLHKTRDGFSGIRDWIMETYSFNASSAGQMASIARLAPKFKHLAEAATSGTASLDAIAYAMRRIEREGLAVHCRVPYPEPVESPYSSTLCRTPEELIREYCIHAVRSELAEHFDRICAELFDQQSMLDEMSQQSLAWLEVSERPDGMWDLDGRLTGDTGKLLSNALRTAVPPPRQDQADDDGLLPRVSGRNAEALHQMVAAYGTSPDAPRRHGHTATLNLLCDIETLRGAATGRLPILDGRPISVSKARFLACEAGILPSVFDFKTGEALELGREKRLPNTALRHKLELEQPDGCAWSGCRAPVSWTEAHHITHWADGGKTDADNLILLCRFHHGRIHTGKWEVVKTGPGKASIVHLNGVTDEEWEADPFKDLPNGHDSGEWSPAYKRELTDIALWYAQKQMQAAIVKARERFKVPPGLLRPSRGGRRLPDPALPGYPIGPHGPSPGPARPSTSLSLPQDLHRNGLEGLSDTRLFAALVSSSNPLSASVHAWQPGEREKSEVDFSPLRFSRNEFHAISEVDFVSAHGIVEIHQVQRFVGGIDDRAPAGRRRAG
ncbi:HNH endonuclease signature motif containing protein [Glycomyces artemisiae]|uniref:HNH endonuclease n=1 Tax=Glycomyces artemisiae TaxID=1076443 RepID=A0A2T0UTH2_9ACTN|nr:HNH endonuclease signature motif containing protein [Glycomyces artemisiae]PRY61204.1 HNH endonuclease [Glycomyces artemisiae]